MQKAVIILFAEIVFLAIPSQTSFAQDIRKYEFFGGLSYAAIADSKIGWNVSAVRNISHNFGIAVDVSRTNTVDIQDVIFSRLFSNANRYLFLAGLQVAMRDPGRWVPYGHVLAGLDHTSYTYDLKADTSLINLGSDSINSFALTFGGGADYSLKGPFAFRLLHADFIIVNSAGTWVIKGKASSGLVLRWGK
jgi:hypothetical protein